MCEFRRGSENLDCAVFSQWRQQRSKPKLCDGLFRINETYAVDEKHACQRSTVEHQCAGSIQD